MGRTTRQQTAAPPQQFLEMQHGDVTLRSLPLWPGYWGGDDGYVYSVLNGRVRPLKPIQNRKLRYPTVTLYHPSRVYRRRLRSGNWGWCKKPAPRYIHALIASVWLPPRPSKRHTIDHRDEDPRNNRPDNLRWLTARENWDAYQANHPDLPRHHHPGESNPSAKLTEEEVRRILVLEGTLTAQMVGDTFGVSGSTVRRIWQRRLWRHVAVPA